LPTIICVMLMSIAFFFFIFAICYFLWSDVKTSKVATQLRNTHAAAGRTHCHATVTCDLVVIVFTLEKTRVAAKCTNERAQGKINKETTVWTHAIFFWKKNTSIWNLMNKFNYILPNCVCLPAWPKLTRLTAEKLWSRKIIKSSFETWLK